MPCPSLLILFQTHSIIESSLCKVRIYTRNTQIKLEIMLKVNKLNKEKLLILYSKKDRTTNINHIITLFFIKDDVPLRPETITDSCVL